MLDASTLRGMYNEQQPYYGYFCPFRFMDVDDVERFWSGKHFEIQYMEKVVKTYNRTKTNFEFIVFEVKKR